MNKQELTPEELATMEVEKAAKEAAESEELAAKEAEKAEKEAVKAEAKAQKEAEKAARITAPAVITSKDWKSIENGYVFIKEPQTAKAFNTANKFAQEDKVKYTIFPTADEPDQKLYWGGINGFFFSVVVGVEVEIPKSIAEHITKS